jgi:hypothetical protein
MTSALVRGEYLGGGMEKERNNYKKKYEISLEL